MKFTEGLMVGCAVVAMGAATVDWFDGELATSAVRYARGAAFMAAACWFRLVRVDARWERDR